MQIKQHFKAKHLRCLLSEIISGEAMALNSVNKINDKMKFPCHKSSFLTLALRRLRRLLCNPLLQPHFDYVCFVWYLDLKKKLKHRIQTTQQVYAFLLVCVFAR